MSGWQRHIEELARLRKELDAPSAEHLQALQQRAQTLLGAVSQAAAEEDVPVGGNLQGLELKVATVRRYLTINPIPLPADVPDDLRQLVGTFENKLLSPSLLQEFQNALAAYADTLRRESQRLQALEKEADATRQTRDVLNAYADLLDALNPPLDS